MEIFAPYDLIVDGTDNFATRYLVNDACVLLGKPYVWGSIYRFDGQASVFWAEYGPCYRCLYPEPPPPGMVPSCAEGGVLGVLCASIGSIQVNEAIKLITGIGDPLVGRLMIYDALEMSYHSVRVQKDPDCAVCGKNPTITGLIDYEEFCGAVSEEAAEAAQGSTISAKDLAAMLDAGDPIFLVDVREPNEYEIVSIPGATLIPKGEFVSGAALEKLPQDKRIVLHCKSGARSAEALAIVKNAGFSDAVHVGGGVLAWISQVDPSLPALLMPHREAPMKGDRVEIVIDSGEGTQTYEVAATRAGRRVDITNRRGIIEVSEVTRTGTPVRTARFMASRVVALVEHPADTLGGGLTCPRWSCSSR